MNGRGEAARCLPVGSQAGRPKSRPGHLGSDLFRRLERDRAMLGERKLLLCVIALACRDYRKGNCHAEGARAFLDGEGFEIYARVLGFSPEDLWERLVAAGEL